MRIYATTLRSFAALSAAYQRDKLDRHAPLISFTLWKIFSRLRLLAVSSGPALPLPEENI